MARFAFLLSLLVAVCAHATPPVETPAAKPMLDPFPMIDPDVMTPGFLAAHPDLEGREAGLKLFEQQDYSAAFKRFTRAARYADKPSQAMLGEMHWKGLGVPQDRVLGYIWMHLAAERKYHEFLVWREAFWQEMDAEERASARVRGQAIYQEYADAVAKPRLEHVLRKESKKATGSLLGYSGQSMKINSYKGGVASGVDPERFYAKKYWEPEAYWALQDAIWLPPQRGRVDVGTLEQLPITPPAADEGDID